MHRNEYCTEPVALYIQWPVCLSVESSVSENCSCLVHVSAMASQCLEVLRVFDVYPASGAVHTVGVYLSPLASMLGWMHASEALCIRLVAPVVPACWRHGGRRSMATRARF